MINVILFYKDEDEETRRVLAKLDELQNRTPHNLVKIRIQDDPVLKARMEGDVPLIEVGPYVLKRPIEGSAIQVALAAAADRQNQLLKMGDTKYEARVKKGEVITRTDKVSYWITQRYMLAISFFLVLYVGLPFLAPVLMKMGLNLPAKAIYTAYSPLCHQFAFRSFFLFGEQNIYPRDLAHMEGVKSYEEITGEKAINLFTARRFIGNPTYGYKVALCERDIAIYGGLFLFGLLFMVTGRRIKPIPWYIWVLLGLVPMGLDGISQLPSLLRDLFPSVNFMRESTPILRLITGGLFGIMTAWFVFPMIEESMVDTRLTLLRKISAYNQRNTI